MPELPEIETIVRALAVALDGATVASVDLLRSDMLRGDADELAGLAGCRLVGVRRAGKYVVMDMASPAGRGWQLMFHLGMTGSLRVLPAVQPMERHTHAVVALSDGRDLRLRDPRRFGRIALAPAPPASGEFAAGLGVATGLEPLEVDDAAFTALFRRRQAPIKNLLLNQKLLRGLGNIYADESLHRAGIDPRARAISAPRLRRLRRAILRVLREAIAAGGSSVSDYISSDGARGWFQIKHRVYGRAGRACPRCGGSIRRLVMAGRSAHFCPMCQRR